MSAPILRRIQPEGVGEVQSFVVDGLAAIVESCPTVPWRAADVLRALLDGRCALYLNDDGFVVVTRKLEEITGRPYLNLWLMWFRPGTGKAVMADVIAWLDQVCKDTACDWWEGSSTREGWGRALRDYCEPAYITWRRVP